MRTVGVNCFPCPYQANTDVQSCAVLMPFICVYYIMPFAFPSSAVPIIGDGRLAGDVDVLGRRVLLPFFDPGVPPVHLAQGGDDQVTDQVRLLLFAGLVAELNLHSAHPQSAA